MRKRLFSGIAALAISMSLVLSPVANAIVPQQAAVVEAAKKSKAKKVTLLFGESKKLSVKKAKSFKSSNKKVVTVTKKGVLTALKPGKATITVKLKKGNPVKYQVTVPDATISQTAANLNIDGSLALSVSNAKNVKWSSSNPGVASVANGVVTGIDVGSAVITAQAGRKVLTCSVNVTDPVVIQQPTITYKTVTRQAQKGKDLIDEEINQVTIKFNGLPKKARHMKKINRGSGKGTTADGKQDGKYLVVACALAAMTAYSEGRDADGQAMMDVLLVSPHISKANVGSASNLSYYFGYDDKRNKLPWAFFDGSKPYNYNRNQPISVTMEEYPYAPELSTFYGPLYIEKIQFHTDNHPCLKNNLTVSVYQDTTDGQWYLWPSGFNSLLSTASIN